MVDSGEKADRAEAVTGRVSVGPAVSAIVLVRVVVFWLAVFG